MSDFLMIWKHPSPLYFCFTSSTKKVGSKKGKTLVAEAEENMGHQHGEQLLQEEVAVEDRGQHPAEDVELVTLSFFFSFLIKYKALLVFFSLFF